MAKQITQQKSRKLVVAKVTKQVKPKVTNKTQGSKTKLKAKVVPKARGSKTVSPEASSLFGPLKVVPYQMAKNEEYMNDKQLEHIKNILLQWKAQLMLEVDKTVQHMQDEAANYPDPVDRASQEEEFTVELRTRDRERKLVKKIDEALNRIKDHDYGYCDDCGAEIGMRRLEARPTATQCIECKTIAELREKQVGEGN